MRRTPSITVAGTEVHVWSAGLDGCRLADHTLDAALAPDERQRAASFRFERDRRRFVAARGILRAILGLYLGRGPAEVRFCSGPGGKPALAAGSGAPPLRFSVSHSRSVALYAVARGRELGIDVEQVLPRPADDEIARQFFSAEDGARLRALAPHLRSREFFRCWTRREASLKAAGGTLSLLGHDDAPSRWSLCELDLGDDLAAALVVEGPQWQLRGFHWDGAFTWRSWNVRTIGDPVPSRFGRHVSGAAPGGSHP